MSREDAVAVCVAVLACGCLAFAGEPYREPLSWNACVREARKNHPDLQSAIEKVKQSRASREITRSAVLPQIAGSASESTSKDTSFAGSGGTIQTGNVGGRGGDTGTGYETTFDFGVTAQQLVFDGFKTSFDLSAAERNIRSALYSYEVTSSNIRLRLRTAYINLMTAQEMLKVAEDIEDRRKRSLELVRLRYEGGREHKGSLMTSDANYAQAQYDVSQAERSIYLAERRLTKELGRSLYLPLEAKGDFEVRDLCRPRPDFDGLARTTPILQQLIAQREAAKFGLNSAYAQFCPQVYGNFNASNSNTRWPPDQNDFSVGTTVEIPLFDGGNMIANVSKAKAVLGQAQEDERSGRDGVIFTLSDTWTKLQDAIDYVGVQRKYLEATEERAKIAQAEYAIGLLSYDNWIIIEDNLVSAKKSHLAAQAAALLAEANWIQAKGGTLDHDL